MANLVPIYTTLGKQEAEKLFSYLLEELRLNGEVWCEHSMIYYHVRTRIKCKYVYLKVQDDLEHDLPGFNWYDYTQEVYDHLKEIKFQFDAYFNAIWG